MNNDITEIANEGRKEPTERDTEKAEYDTNLEKNNVVERITFQKSPPRSTGSSRKCTPTSTRSSRTSSPKLRSNKKNRSTPSNKQSPPNKSLIVVSTHKRKYQEGYNRQECIEEHLNRNLEIMMELATLQEKSRTDEEEKLRMSKALLCK